MKHQEAQAESESPVRTANEKDLSRRKFLQTTAIAGMAAVAFPASGIAQPGPAEHRSNPKHPLEKILHRYGSEFGDVTQIG